uniref:Uncharacterized protein n=1 Tax=Anguilla anguilla TaxID=7936 RepID=A0A0E9RYD7_ANGAN
MSRASRQGCLGGAPGTAAKSPDRTSRAAPESMEGSSFGGGRSVPFSVNL